MSTASSQASPSEAQRAHVSQEQRTAEAKAAFVASLNSVGSDLDTDLQLRAKDIHANAKALDKQEKELQKETKKLAKQSDAMQKVVDKTKNDLKDFENMPDMMADLDADLAILEETLRLAEQGDDEYWESDEEMRDGGHDTHEGDELRNDESGPSHDSHTGLEDISDSRPGVSESGGK